MESPEPSPDDLREETEQGGYEESEESEADTGQSADDPDSPPDQDTSAQTGAEQGGGF
jgi:hypothetical protein